jgi:tetratricopeptide (TPR) repeat protein
MRRGQARALVFAAASLWLAGCASSGNHTAGKTPEPAPAPRVETAQAVPPPLGVSPEIENRLLGSDPNDDLSLGKKQYRAGNYGVAERYYRHAAELHPRDAEVWLGLAACYDQLRRFDLADRAYREAIRIVGPTVAILNNQGYSYMLRGDFRRARATLLAAQRKDPDNPYVANNLRLLQASIRRGKALEQPQ